MARRFSRIKQAAYLAQAVDNYVQFISQAATRPRNVGGGVDRPPLVEIGVEPFGFDLAGLTKARATATQAARTQMGSAVGTHVSTTGSDPLERVPGFKPAKVTLFVGTGSSTVATSNITGLRYLKYGGNSYGHPFGRSTGTDLEYDVFSSIRTALRGTNRRISYQPESRKQVY